VLLLAAGRAALRQFGAEATLSDGARAYATCEAPWRSARVAAPADRFTLWVMTGGTGDRRAEGVSALGARCRVRARRRMAFAAAVLAGGGVLTWLTLPPRSGAPPDLPPPPAPAP
jgi:hypothetical protein